MGALALARSKFALASFSRAQELEADGIGVGIAARAGYDPYGAVAFPRPRWATMPNSRPARTASIARSTDFMSSHPATPDRIQNAQLNARQHVAPGAGERERNGYLASLNGMIYGDDPADGFVRGRRFVHPRLGFTFTAPEGFALENTAQAVLGVKNGGTEAMRLDVVRIPAEQTLQDYLASGWIDGVEAGSRRISRSTAFPRRPQPPRATNGRSGFTPSASAPTSIASSTPPRTGPPRPTAISARRSRHFGA